MPGGYNIPLPKSNDPNQSKRQWVRHWIFLTVSICIFGTAFLYGVSSSIRERTYDFALIVGMFTGLPLTAALIRWVLLLRVLIRWKT